MTATRIAAIDRGTNSIRCIVLLVSRLADILRLADGLDRRRAGFVQDIAVEFSGTMITISLGSTEDISVEILGGNAKKDLFEKAFGAEVVFATPSMIDALS